MLAFNFNMLSILIVIYFCDLCMKSIKEDFEIVEECGEIFRPVFWLGNFNTISLGPRILQIAYNVQMPAYCAVLFPFLSSLGKQFITQINYDSGTKGYFHADYFI